MPRLVLLNGAPGSGKSTLARRYAEDHPLTLVLDIDQVRGMLGRWLDQPTDAGVLARDLAVAMARTQLDAGRDVLVPQYLGRLEFVETLQQLADTHDKLLAVVAARPATRVITTIDGDIKGVYAQLLDALSS